MNHGLIVIYLILTVNKYLRCLNGGGFFRDITDTASTFRLYVIYDNCKKTQHKSESLTVYYYIIILISLVYCLSELALILR